MKGKGCPTFGPIGPWLVTRRRDRRSAEAVDVARRQRRADAERLDGDDDLRRRTLVSYISQFMILEPGDVITTGTPPGVGDGKKPPRYPEGRRHGLARHRRPRPAGAARRRLVEVGLSARRRCARRARISAQALAALYAAAFVVAYWLYAQAAGAFMADLWLSLAAIPYMLTTAALTGSSDFAADFDRRGAGGGGVLLRARLCRGRARRGVAARRVATGDAQAARGIGFAATSRSWPA